MSRMFADELLDLGRIEVNDRVIEANNLIRSDEKMIQELKNHRGDINTSLEQLRLDDYEIVRLYNRIKINKVILEKCNDYKECLDLLTKIMDKHQSKNP